MKDLETKERFLELRAQEKSLRTIEKEIGTGRRTLAEWENEFKEELENRKAIELEALREKYWLTRQARTKSYGEEYKRAIEELKKRDLSTIATPKLVDMALKLDALLREEELIPDIVDDAHLGEQKAFRSYLDSMGSFYTPMQSLKKKPNVKNGNGKRA
jgi:hypothetical protein